MDLSEAVIPGTSNNALMLRPVTAKGEIEHRLKPPPRDNVIYLYSPKDGTTIVRHMGPDARLGATEAC
jgi:hypothetical protein